MALVSKEITALERTTLEASLKAQDAPRPPAIVHPAVRHLVPTTWDGKGEVPPGWSRGFTVEKDASGKLTLACDATLASKVTELQADAAVALADEAVKP